MINYIKLVYELNSNFNKKNTEQFFQFKILVFQTYFKNSTINSNKRYTTKRRCHIKCRNYSEVKS